MPLTLVEIPRQSVAPYTDFNKPPGSEVFSCGEGIEMHFKEAKKPPFENIFVYGIWVGLRRIISSGSKSPN